MYNKGDSLRCLDDVGSGGRLEANRIYTVKNITLNGIQLHETRYAEGVDTTEWDPTRFTLIALAGKPEWGKSAMEKVSEVLRSKMVGYKLKPGPVYRVRVEIDNTKAPYQPAIHCRGCNVTAPFKLVTDVHRGNMLGTQPQYYPDLTGWLVMDYPYRDPYHIKREEGVDPRTPFAERYKMCPRCAKTIMGTVVHIETNGVRR